MVQPLNDGDGKVSWELSRISAGGHLHLSQLFAESCQDHSAKDEALLQISIGTRWLRHEGKPHFKRWHEGKPHFKRWGMSQTGTLRSGCQVWPGMGMAKATKAEDQDSNGIEQEVNLSSPSFREELCLLLFLLFLLPILRSLLFPV